MTSHLGWPLNGFETLHAPVTRYPIRFLRYWFPRLILERLHQETGEPLSILEIGIDTGQMRQFVGGRLTVNGRIALPDWIAHWDGLDVKVDQRVLERYSYSNYFEADVEQPFDLGGRQYHAVVLLHVLEHLWKPEIAMSRLAAALRPNGLMIGGSPTMPEVIALLHEPWLRWKHRKVLDNVLVHRHLSVITPSRIKRFARDNSFQLELLAGAFFCRWSGMFLENFEAWTRANLFWGSLFPSLGGELYFSLRNRQ